MSFLAKTFGINVDAPPVNYAYPSFSAGGFNGNLSGNNYNLSPTADRSAAVSGMSNAYKALGDSTGDLAAGVAPGYNDLLRTRLGDLNDQATSAIGNLRDNLASRRVLGSSFGSDTLARANNEFNKQRDSVIADNYLRSIDASSKLLQQKYGAYAQSFNSALSELNLEAGIASNLSTNAASILAENARTQATLGEKASEAQAKNMLEFGTGVGKLFGRAAFGMFG